MNSKEGNSTRRSRATSIHRLLIAGAVTLSLVLGDAAAASAQAPAAPIALVPSISSHALVPHGVTSELARTTVAVRTVVRTVASGNTLSGLTAQICGSAELWPTIWKQNPWLKNPNRIYPGQKISFTCQGAKGSSASKASATRAVAKKPASPQGKRAKVLSLTRAQIGDWYLWGASGPNRFDCSGLVLWVYGHLGINLPHKANLQQRYGKAVSKANARPGDLVFFRYSNGYAYHVGIYVGNGYMIDAPGRNRQINKRKIWSSRITFRRLL